MTCAYSHEIAAHENAPRWMNEEHTLLLATLEDGWTWDDFHTAVDRAFLLIRNAKTYVDVIVELQGAPSAPMITMFEHVRGAMVERPSNYGHMVVVGASLALRLMVGRMLEAFPDKKISLHYADTVQEAIIRLNKARSETERL
mgnify:CR=1 FL=1